MKDVCICSSTEAWTESEVQLTVQMASSSIQDHRTASAICKLHPKSPKTTQNAKLKPRSFKAPIQLVYRINWFKEEGQWAKWFFITWNTPKDSTSVLNFPFKETFLFLWLLKSGALLAHLRVGDSSHLPCVPLEHLLGIAEVHARELPARMPAPGEGQTGSQWQKCVWGGECLWRVDSQLKFQLKVWNLKWISPLLANRKGSGKRYNREDGTSLCLPSATCMPFIPENGAYFH